MSNQKRTGAIHRLPKQQLEIHPVTCELAVPLSEVKETHILVRKPELPDNKERQGGSRHGGILRYCDKSTN